MSIQELSSKFKGIFTNPEYQLSLLIIVVATASFGLGRLSQGTVTELQEIPSQAQMLGTAEQDKEPNMTQPFQLLLPDFKFVQSLKQYLAFHHQKM